MDQLRIVVASNNPVKLLAAEQGFRRMYPECTLSVNSVEVSSGVAEQPLSDDETLKGAINRAHRARESRPEAEFWVGIEGGVDMSEQQAFAWVAILGPGGTGFGKSRTATFMLPRKAFQMIKEGISLSQIDDELFGRTESGKKMGAIGLYTKGAIERTAYHESAVVCALVPFVNQELFEG